MRAFIYCTTFLYGLPLRGRPNLLHRYLKPFEFEFYVKEDSVLVFFGGGGNASCIVYI
jgi:hypothetical protein